MMAPTFTLLLLLSFVSEASLRLLPGVSSVSDLLACLGEERVAVHFPSTRHLLAAVAHGWDRDALRVVGCVDLRAARRAIAEASERLNATARLVFHSGSRNLACLEYRLGRSELGFFHDSGIIFRSVFPMLDALKMDVSLPHILGFLEELGRRPSSEVRVDHPMQRDFAERGAVELQVLLRGRLDAGQLRARAESWVERAGSGTGVAARPEGFYWTSGLVDEDRPAGQRSPFPLRGGAATEAAISVHRNATHYSPERHWRLWRRLLEDSDESGTRPGCGFSGVEIRPRRRSVHLAYALDAVPLRLRAACLASLVLEVSLDAEVAQLGLGRPMRLTNMNTRAIVQGDHGLTPFVAAGLDGSGVVIGQSDTGVDRNSCFFVDREHGPCASCSVDQPAVDLRQRKVVQYVDFSGSSGDYSGGHGSHVSLRCIHFPNLIILS